jgi:hypothetical protein
VAGGCTYPGAFEELLGFLSGTGGLVVDEPLEESSHGALLTAKRLTTAGEVVVWLLGEWRVYHRVGSHLLGCGGGGVDSGQVYGSGHWSVRLGLAPPRSSSSASRGT